MKCFSSKMFPHQNRSHPNCRPPPPLPLPPPQATPEACCCACEKLRQQFNLFSVNQQIDNNTFLFIKCRGRHEMYHHHQWSYYLLPYFRWQHFERVGILSLEYCAYFSSSSSSFLLLGTNWAHFQQLTILWRERERKIEKKKNQITVVNAFLGLFLEKGIKIMMLFLTHLTFCSNNEVSFET